MWQNWGLREYKGIPTCGTSYVLHLNLLHCMKEFIPHPLLMATVYILIHNVVTVLYCICMSKSL